MEIVAKRAVYLFLILRMIAAPVALRSSFTIPHASPRFEVRVCAWSAEPSRSVLPRRAEGRDRDPLSGSRRFAYTLFPRAGLRLDHRPHFGLPSAGDTPRAPSRLRC